MKFAMNNHSKSLMKSVILPTYLYSLRIGLGEKKSKLWSSGAAVVRSVFRDSQPLDGGWGQRCTKEISDRPLSILLGLSVQAHTSSRLNTCFFCIFSLQFKFLCISYKMIQFTKWPLWEVFSITKTVHHRGTLKQRDKVGGGSKFNYVIFNGQPFMTNMKNIRI